MDVAEAYRQRDEALSFIGDFDAWTELYGKPEWLGVIEAHEARRITPSAGKRFDPDAVDWGQVSRLDFRSGRAICVAVGTAKRVGNRVKFQDAATTRWHRAPVSRVEEATDDASGFTTYKQVFREFTLTDRDRRMLAGEDIRRFSA